MAEDIYVLGGAQTDFARNWTKEGRGIADMLGEVVPNALADAQTPAGDVEVLEWTFAALAFLVGGVVAPTGYLIAGIVFGVFAVGFTAMSRHLRNSGAFYAYIRRGLGPVAGSGAALVADLAYALGQLGFAAVAGLFASTTLRDLFGISVPWQVSALVLGLVVAVLSYLKVDIGARVLAVLLTAEIAILLVLAVAVTVASRSAPRPAKRRRIVPPGASAATRAASAPALPAGPPSTARMRSPLSSPAR